jgi:hypothetical protein
MTKMHVKQGPNDVRDIKIKIIGLESIQKCLQGSISSVKRTVIIVPTFFKAIGKVKQSSL